MVFRPNRERSLHDSNVKGLLAVIGANFAVALSKWVFFEPDGSAVAWTVDVATHVVLPFLLVFILARRFSVVPSLYGLSGFTPDRRRLNFLAALVPYSLLLGLASFVGYVVGLVVDSFILVAPSTGTDYRSMMPSADPARLVVLLYLACSAGVFEEIFYRGLFQLLCDVMFPSAPRIGIVAASAFLFSLTHWGGGAVAISVSLFFGLAAAWLFSYQRDLRPLMLSHVFIDVVIGLQP